MNYFPIIYSCPRHKHDLRYKNWDIRFNNKTCSLNSKMAQMGFNPWIYHKAQRQFSNRSWPSGFSPLPHIVLISSFVYSLFSTVATMSGEELWVLLLHVKLPCLSKSPVDLGFIVICNIRPSDRRSLIITDLTEHVSRDAAYSAIFAAGQCDNIHQRILQFEGDLII